MKHTPEAARGARVGWGAAAKAAGAPSRGNRPPALDSGARQTAVQPNLKACVSRISRPQSKDGDGAAGRDARSPRQAPRRKAQPIRRLGDDIGGELILDEGDAVAQLQLAFLEALHLDCLLYTSPSPRD